MSKFKKAERKKSRLRLGLTGTSGSGKTYSSLRLAQGLGFKTAVIDSEKGSASLYSHLFDFDVLELDAPFTTEKYIAALKDAQAEGYELVIVDSISHAWAGEGGLLQQKEKLDSTGKGNSFTNWAKMTPKQEQFISAIVQSPMHVIVTMRSKTEYSQQQEAGKTKIQKVGLAPVQRDGFEYELTTVFDIGSSHEAECSKDRTGLFVDQIFKITEETGKIIREWLESGKEPEPIAKAQIQLEEPIKAKVVLNHAPQTQAEAKAPSAKKELVTYKTFTFANPDRFKGKHFHEIDSTELGDYVEKISWQYVDKPMPQNVEWFFNLYNEYKKSTSV